VDQDLVFEKSPPYTPIVSSAGYVTNRRLVLKDDKSFRLAFGPIQVSLGAPRFAGTLIPLNPDLTPRDPSLAPRSRGDRFYRIDDGVFAGRLPQADVLGLLGAFPLPGTRASPTYLCTSALFAQLKQQACSSLDLAASPALDFDPNADCTAASTAFRATAVPAVAGAAVARPPTINPCVQGPSAIAGLAQLYSCSDLDGGP
jgi:hypothetical protein